MAVNLTWHSFLEQVWGIRLRCRTNCTCCETSELQLFRTRFQLVRGPAAAKHKRHFAPNTKRLWQLGQRNDKCRLNMRMGRKTQKQVLLSLSLFFFLLTGRQKSWTPRRSNTCWHYDICFAKTSCERRSCVRCVRACVCAVKSFIFKSKLLKD